LDVKASDTHSGAWRLREGRDVHGKRPMPFNIVCRMLIRFNSKQHTVTRRIAPTSFCVTSASNSRSGSLLVWQLSAVP
jgi:hypothetical protein